MNYQYIKNYKMEYSPIITEIFIAFWGLLGIVSFFMSIYCFGYNSSLGSKIAGLLIAMFFGPFYWIYYYFMKGYCRV